LIFFLFLFCSRFSVHPEIGSRNRRLLGLEDAEEGGDILGTAEGAGAARGSGTATAAAAAPMSLDMVLRRMALSAEGKHEQQLRRYVNSKLEIGAVLQLREELLEAKQMYQVTRRLSFSFLRDASFIPFFGITACGQRGGAPCDGVGTEDAGGETETSRGVGEVAGNARGGIGTFLAAAARYHGRGR
jgi:hypothetical protein